ncbi:Zn-ribbon domain-containing OB-fold protein [Aeromicrobium ginsengisoli]|uniref:DNA-binding protein n=1 Tax=Aeromicrobium ginsengisoli TaxID=363867 RepID=A0A5M4FAH9_9ACTN|nr:OB-fold domain-containing protein [Aeromicrobium ginsengisoli]KAA1394249.1 DNA-binding protein [Aeromicrobium ginsengisoli]
MTATSAEALPAGPSESGDDADFWQALDEHRLALPRCTACGAWRQVGTATCPACWSFDIAWDDVSPIGTVYTWVRTHRDFMSELDVKAPYVTVLVQLDDVPVRLLGLLVGGDEIAIGDRVSGVFQKPGNSDWTILRWEKSV